MQNICKANFLSAAKIHRQRILISVLWIAGLVAGKHLAQISPWVSAFNFGFSSCTMPYYGGAVMIVSSILIGGVACVLGRRPLYIFLFLKAVIYGIVSMNVALAFGDAGWLARILLLSTDTALVIILLLFSIQSVGERFESIMRNATFSLVAALFLVLIDAYLIAPFTTSLLNG